MLQQLYKHTDSETITNNVKCEFFRKEDTFIHTH